MSELTRLANFDAKVLVSLEGVSYLVFRGNLELQKFTGVFFELLVSLRLILELVDQSA